MTAFEEMGIMAEIAKAVDKMEWMLPTDIQAEAIPLILGGGDVLMAAETGSGKTGAFCLPILQIVWETINDKHSSTDSGVNKANDEWMLSAVDLDVNLSLKSDLLSASSRGATAWQGCRANRGVIKSASKENRFYYEVLFTDSGLARIGWSLADSALDLGTDKHGWGYGGTAKKSNSKNFDSYGETFGEKFDVIGNIIDLDLGTISWTKNNKDLGIAFRLPNQLYELNAFYPAICIKNAGITVKFKSDSIAPNNCIWIADAIKSQVCLNPKTSSSRSKAKDNSPKAVIIEPSRELAQQTYNCIKSFKEYLSGQIRIQLLIGGDSAKDQISQIEAGVEIVVATPGRLDELVMNGHLSLSSCRFFVLDEVDGLLQQGNKMLIKKWHSMLPRMFDDGKRLQLIVCSATLHNFDVKNLATDIMFFPTWVDLKGEDSIPETVHHVILRVDPRTDTNWKTIKRHITTDKVHAKDSINTHQPNKETLSEAVKILKGEYVLKAIDTLKINKAIIFCRTKLDCDNLENYFKSTAEIRNAKNSYSCVCLHADRKPFERKENLEKFKTGRCNFLICTDVAARGIDISGIPFVIQVTLSDEVANYLHRIGRVGRAERMGLAISLVSSVPEKVWYHSCASKGKACYDTRLVEESGCCMWYNELQILANIEDNLNCIVQEIKTDFKIEVNEFDGKVTYGAKSSGHGYSYSYHVSQLSNVVAELAQLEAKAQNNYLKFYSSKNIL